MGGEMGSSEQGIKDPSNWNKEDIFTVRLQDDILLTTEGDREMPGQPLSDRCFRSDLGLIEFEDTQKEEVRILNWGKATRFYPINETEYRLKNVIEYLVDVPGA